MNLKTSVKVLTVSSSQSLSQISKSHTLSPQCWKQPLHSNYDHRSTRKVQCSTSYRISAGTKVKGYTFETFKTAVNVWTAMLCVSAASAYMAELIRRAASSVATKMARAAGKNKHVFAQSEDTVKGRVSFFILCVCLLQAIQHRSVHSQYLPKSTMRFLE